MRKLARPFLYFFAALWLTGSAAPALAEPLNSEGAFSGASALNASYFPVFPLGAGDLAAPQLLPVVSNHTLDGDHHGLTHAVIIVHDLSRDANGIAGTIASLAGPEGNAAFILAPQFLIDSDVARLAGIMAEQSKMLVRWPLDGWVMGGDSIAIPPQKAISSFTAFDLLLLYLGEKKFFPDLQSVTVAGLGAGGDFVQRYAAVGQAPDILDLQHLQVRFLVADASSYLYFTAPRFLVAKPGAKPSLGTPGAAICSTYNNYPYGLENPNAYVKRVGSAAIKLRYVTRPVTYVTGEKIQEDVPPDASCAAQLQGSDRLTRQSGYNMYLKVTFGDAAEKLHKFMTIPKAGYEPAALFGSPCGMAVLLGDGMCW